MSCQHLIARHAALGTAWLSLSLGAFAAWVKVKNPKAPGSEGRGRRGVRTNTQPLAVDLRLFIAPTREYASPSPTSCPVRRRWLRASSPLPPVRQKERAMLNNLSAETREWYQQAVTCARQADAQTDPKVKQQYLELKRLWLLLARSYGSTESLTDFSDETK